MYHQGLYEKMIAFCYICWYFMFMMSCRLARNLAVHLLNSNPQLNENDLALLLISSIKVFPLFLNRSPYY